MRRSFLLLLAGLLLPGCGTVSSPSGSSTGTNDATTSRVEFNTQGPDISAGLSLLTATGSIDYARSRGELVIKAATDKGGTSGDIHAMFIGHDTYLGAMADGKIRWLKETSESDGVGLDRFLPGPNGTNPNQLLAVLKKLSSKVEVLGEEKVRGVPATHYKAHLDNAKLGDAAQDSPGELVVETWIDDNDLARRVRVPFGDDPPSAEVVDLYDYGIPVDIKVPAAEEILSQAEFDKIMEKECSTGKTHEKPTTICMFFGTDLVSSGGGEISPTETMPRRVTEGK